jgi:hypothetical protein
MRQAYRIDSCTFYQNTAIFCADLQKVLLIPVMPTKSCFFTKGLVCFNETFSSLSQQKDICVLWHEAISGRSASSLTSAYFRLICSESDEFTEFIFWMDNCTAQNKNWIFYAALCTIVNSLPGIRKITLKYLERGHTYNNADSVHGSIANALKRKSLLYNFMDLKELMISSRTNISVLEMNSAHFLVWASYPVLKNKPKLSQIRVVEFRKGSPCIYWKSNIKSSEFNFLPLFPDNTVFTISIENFPYRGLNSEKKQQIISTLLPLMPQDKHDFWNQLPSSDAPDLVSNI